LLNISGLAVFAAKILSTKMRFIRKHILSLFQNIFKNDFCYPFPGIHYLQRPSLLYVLWFVRVRKDGRLYSYLNLKGLSSFPGKTFLFSVPAKSTDDLADNQDPGSAATRKSSGYAARDKPAESWMPGGCVQN
jgi:hypothetical protein